MATRPLVRVEAYPLPPYMAPPGKTGYSAVYDRRGREQYPRIDRSLQLPYEGNLVKGRMKKSGSPLAPWSGFPADGDPYFGNAGWVLGTPPWWGKPTNRAYEKFKEKALGESTALGVFLAERKEGYGMVARRITGLYRAYRSLRRGDFRRFLRELSVDPKRKHRSVVRTSAAEASGLWLEYWFGWSPALNDLYNVGTVLANVPSPVREYGAAAIRLPYVLTRAGAGSTRYREFSQHGKFIVKTGAGIRVDNPDTQLLQQMGLINPLVVAWEVVPFSFVVDWFTRFGDVLSATSDFVGCTLIDPYTSYYGTGREEWVIGDLSKRPECWEYYVERHKSRRTTALIKPVATRPSWLNYGNSKTRAVTAASLLTQLFLAK